MNKFHVSAPVAVNKYQCTNCHRFHCSTKRILREHFLDCCVGSTPCYQCLDVFSSAKEKRLHMEKEHKPKFDCVKCGERIRGHQELNDHMKEHEAIENATTSHNIDMMSDPKRQSGVSNSSGGDFSIGRIIFMHKYTYIHIYTSY